MEKDEVLESLSSRISTMSVLKSAYDASARSKINFDQKKAIVDREIIALNTLLIVYKNLINEFAITVPTINDFISNLGDNAETNISIL